MHEKHHSYLYVPSFWYHDVASVTRVMDCPEASSTLSSGCVEPFELVYLSRRKRRKWRKWRVLSCERCVHVSLCVHVGARHCARDILRIMWLEFTRTCCRFRPRPQYKHQMPSCSRLCNTWPSVGAWMRWKVGVGS